MDAKGERPQTEAQATGKKRGGRGVLIGLHVLLLLYSFADVLSKYAAGTEFLSLPFIGLYGGVLLLLALYALGWQQVIARMPLTAAYANRAVTLVWGIVWGFLFFHEDVTPTKLVGAAVIMAGIVLFAHEDGREAGGRRG